ncbi:MAG: double-strand break repair protein AddB [Hyphomicrobiaceae bacterium]|nr:MAG: double-strand break repair protein AddB [Hyphomicrobiaceae bacterium]
MKQQATQQAARRVYTVPQGTPFLTALAHALLAGDLPVPGGPRPDPLELADVTLMLPTRRATRALQDAFLKAANGSAMLLPRIRPIGEGADELGIIAGLADADARDGGAASIRPAITEIERQLVLTKLVLQWSRAMRHGSGGDGELLPYSAAGASTPAQAAHLAKELARLMDVVEIEEVSLSALATLVPDTFSEHWARTLKFLEVVTEFWPLHLKERGLFSPMQRRNALMLAEAERLAAVRPGAPVIVAGVTGTVPAATRLMSVVAGLPNGAIVLPALDLVLDEASWNALVPAHPEHPQFGLKKLIDALGLKRETIMPLRGAVQSRRQRARWSLASEAMRPAGTTERWHKFVAGASKEEMAQALAGVAILDAPNAEDEAEAIALILRDVAQTPGKTAALISPDRLLARRVSTRLQSWGLQVDDSAGVPFAKTVPGAFLDLVVEAVVKRIEPVALVTLLKHPLCRLGMKASDLRCGARALELAVCRAPYFGHEIEGIASALARAERDMRRGARRHRAVRRLRPEDLQAAHDLLQRLDKALRPMQTLFASSAPTSLHMLAKAHAEAAQALAATGEGEDSPLWLGEAGEAAALLFTSLMDAGMPAPEIEAADYPELYRSLVAAENIRPRGSAHPRLFIWGLFESRLQQPDIVILASLNEGTWPQAADPGPWLNRPMRKALGLPAPEERIGYAAHDFASLFGADRVYLTRAAKIDGVPTVPSRWLLRLEALLAGMGQTATPDQPWLAWAQGRNSIEGAPKPVRAPTPRPALALRPRQLSVTAVEKWIANPYALFAQRILGLEPLPPLGLEPDAALRGQIVHDALSRFARRFPEALPDDACGELLALAEAALADYTGSPRVAAFWAPRFARFAAWFAETEPARRAGMTRTIAEVDGRMVLEGPGGAFTLTARADRVDIGAGGVVITDYKTGSNLASLAGRAKHGEAPQLPLEAAIALTGGFAGVGKGPVLGLRYISASGGEPPGHERDLDGDAALLARDAEAGLARLIAEFDREATPYRALRRARFTYDYDDYAHLARVAEWSAENVEEG